MSHGNPDTDTLLLANLTSDPEIARRLRILAAIERRYDGAAFNDPDAKHATVLKIALPRGTRIHGDLLTDMAQFAADGETMTAEERAGRAAGEIAQALVDIEVGNMPRPWQNQSIHEWRRQAHAILGNMPPLMLEAQYVARAFLARTDRTPSTPVETETYMAAAWSCISWKQVAEAVASL